MGVNDGNEDMKNRHRPRVVLVSVEMVESDRCWWCGCWGWEVEAVKYMGRCAHVSLIHSVNMFI